jgi:hypothetical protein
VGAGDGNDGGLNAMRGSGGSVTGMDRRRGKEGGCCSRGRERKRTMGKKRGRGHDGRHLLKRRQERYGGPG